YEKRSLTIAQSVAGMPSVGDGLRDSDPSRTLQPLAEGIRKASGASFVVIAGANGIRYSHPNPAMIGKPIDEDFHTVLAGKTWVGVEHGTLGVSARGKAPIFDGQGRVIGIVSVGFLEGTLSQQLAAMLPQLALYMLVALALGVAGSILLARRLKRQTFGLEPGEIATLLEQREASLHGIREGTIATDIEGRITLINDEARRLLRLSGDSVGKPLTDVLPPGRVRDLLIGEVTGADEVVLAADRVLVVSRMPVVVRGRTIGYVATFRDRTELESLLRELDNARSLTEALRAQAHDFSNRLHTIAGLIELGRQEEAIQKADGDVVIHVHDSGPGISRSDLGQIFSEGFTTKLAGPGSRRGLGLALVQQVAARRGGEVTVINQGGALFTVRLPLSAKPASVGAS